MRWLARALVAVLGLAAFGDFALFAGLGPVAFLPGGWLWGERREPPADWAAELAAPDLALVTAEGRRFALVAHAFFVHAGSRTSTHTRSSTAATARSTSCCATAASSCRAPACVGTRSPRATRAPR
jgi:hypothetical protein